MQNLSTRRTVLRELRGLGRRRTDLANHQAAIRQLIALTVRQAQEAGVAMTDVAAALQMDRSALYRTYVQPAIEPTSQREDAARVTV